MKPLSAAMLAMNAAWDAGCGLAMLAGVRVPILGTVHMGMLLDQQHDAQNPTVRLLFAICVLNGGFLRAMAVYTDNVWLAIYSYVFEALLMVCGCFEPLIAWGCAALCGFICYSLIITDATHF